MAAEQFQHLVLRNRHQPRAMVFRLRDRKRSNRFDADVLNHIAGLDIRLQFLRKSLRYVRMNVTVMLQENLLNLLRYRFLV